MLYIYLYIDKFYDLLVTPFYICTDFKSGPWPGLLFRPPLNEVQFRPHLVSTGSPELTDFTRIFYPGADKSAPEFYINI